MASQGPQPITRIEESRKPIKESKSFKQKAKPKPKRGSAKNTYGFEDDNFGYTSSAINGMVKISLPSVRLDNS